MSTYAVHVSNISEHTTEEGLHRFFSFCGEIVSLEYDEKRKTAEIHFNNATSAGTAVMMSGGALDGASFIVTSDSDVAPGDETQKSEEEQSESEKSESEKNESEDNKDVPIDQSDKPRAAIVAEYLAKGYVLSDSILQRAIEMDHKQGISQRFQSWIKSLDSSVGGKVLGPEKTISGKAQETINVATQQAKTVDEQKGISKSAQDYYSKALSSPLGQKVLSFYTTTSKQVLDIHEEARRLAQEQKAAQ